MNATVSKAARLAYCEQTIAIGKMSFLDVSRALAEIMEDQLYLEKGYGSFAEYCEKEWGFKKSYAYQLVNTADMVKQSPELSTIVENPAQARELARIPADKRAEVLGKAGDKPTAKAIRQAAKVTLAEASQPTSRPEPEQPAALKGIDQDKVDKLDDATESESLESIVAHIKRIETQITRSDLDGDDLILISGELLRLAKLIKKIGEQRKIEGVLSC